MTKDYFKIIDQKMPFLKDLLESIHEMALILDKNRKIVYFNSKFADFAEQYDIKAQVGLTPGSALNCINTLTSDIECGSTDFCRYCGGNKVITENKTGAKAFSECRIAALNGNAYDLKVSASSLEIDGDTLTLYCIMNNSDTVRKQILEKIFFHDINNLVNGIGMITALILDNNSHADTADLDKTLHLLNESVENLKNEINYQHILSLAEKSELTVHPRPVSINEMLSDVVSFFGSSSTGKGVLLESEPSDEKVIRTDPVIMRRVLINMIKNAVEASSSGQKVTVAANQSGENVVISVHNESVIPEDVSKSLFKRSFSTKGKGRGLGTYSMKLLTERYLHGKIYFATAEGYGTTFYMEIPVS